MKKHILTITMVIVVCIILSCGCFENNNGKGKNNPPLLEIIYPTTSFGFDYFYNDTFSIKWKASDKDNDDLKINLFYSLDNNSWNVIASNESNDGEYNWSIGSDKLMTERFSSTFFLKITASDGKEEAQHIVHTFIGWSFPQGSVEYIEIISPNGGENLTDIQNITWKIDLIDNYNISIELYDTLKDYHLIIVEDFEILNYTTVSDGFLCSYQFVTTKFGNGNKYWIIIKSGDVYDHSNDNFSIFNEKNVNKQNNKHQINETNNKTNFSFERHKIANIEIELPYVGSMAVSNDNKMIVWMERNYTNGKYSIFFSKTNGSSYNKIYVSSNSIRDLHFSLDDKKIVFVSNSNAYEINLNGENKTLYLQNVEKLLIINEFEFIVKRNTNVSFVNESNVTIYQNHRNLVYLNIKKKQSINLTNYYDSSAKRKDPEYAIWYITGIDLCLDKRYLIYSLDYDDGVVERRGRGTKDFEPGIYKVNFDGSNHKCMYKKEDLWGVKFSPDYTKILYHSGASSHSNPIWIIDVNGKNATQLTNLVGPRDYENKAFFTGDGLRIIYDNYIQNDEYRNIWMMNINGTNKTKLTPDDAFYSLYLIGPNGKDIYYSKDIEIWIMFYENNE